TAATAPATTTDPGPFTAATTTPANPPASASDIATAAIAPPDGNPCINRARAATTTHASARSHTPDTSPPATPPPEPPPPTPTTTPQPRSTSHNATPNANTPTCPYPVNPNPPSGPPNTASATGTSNTPARCRSSSPHTRSNAARY